MYNQPQANFINIQNQSQLTQISQKNEKSSGGLDV